MTPHEALSHALTPHQAGPWRHWSAELGRTRVTVIRYHSRRTYDLRESYPDAVLPGPHTDRYDTAREVLTRVRELAVEESADTTRIDAALAALVEP